MKRLMITIMAVLLILTPVTFAASENSVNYTPRVRDDHVFTQNDAPVLRIEESSQGDFRDGEVVRLHLQNAEWNNYGQIPDDTQVRGSATDISVSRVSSTTLQVTLNKDEGIDEKAFYQIPLYTKTTAGGYATVRIDPWTGGATAETLNFAGVVGPEKPGDEWLREDMPDLFEDEELEEPTETEEPVEEPTEDIEEPAEEPEEPTTIQEPTEVIFTIDETGYYQDGIRYPTDAAPYIQPLPGGVGRTMMPVSHVALALGAEEVIWDEANRTVTVRKGEDTLQLTIDEPELLLNNETILMDTPAVIKPTEEGLGRTVIPVAHLARALGVEYQWDSGSRSITFTN